ncbi:hypothetical protein [Ideonella alba]|uniref:Uncharacterized protein n=1 Tax=Ideonella alba TaxID=2824118 RepID=A0A940Y2C0_9BURK|nr:hypothetical protein [Ideonella alba]MBQ0929064.1 hypothetical protein [Ideonella alba]
MFGLIKFFWYLLLIVATCGFGLCGATWVGIGIRDLLRGHTGGELGGAWAALSFGSIALGLAWGAYKFATVFNDSDHDDTDAP